MKSLKIKYRAERNIWVVDARRAGINTPTFGSFKTELEARKAADELLAKFTLGMVAKKVEAVTAAVASYHFMELQEQRVINGQISKSYKAETATNLNFVLQYKIDGKKFRDHDLAKLVQPTNQEEILLCFEKCIKDTTSSKATAEKRLKYTKAFLNYCTNKRWIKYNPLDKFTFGRSSDLSDRAPRIQEGVIQAVIKNGLSVATLKEKAMVIIALATGMRQGELRALPWGNIDFNEGEIIVDRAIKKGTSITGTTKTKRGNRTIPIDEKSMKVLKEWKMQSKFSQATDYVFGSGVNTVMLSKYFAPICKKICDAAGVEVLRWSDFRHCFASNQLSGLGEDWAEVARLMGHATPSFTYQQYGHYVKNVAKNNKARNASAAAMYG
jgi:integrase